MARVPEVDVVPEVAATPEDRIPAELELEQFKLTNELLAAEARVRVNYNKETDQRYALRWAAFATSLAIIAGMGLLLWHVSHRVIEISLGSGEPPTAYIVAVFVAPIASMTTLSIALLVASFRRFEPSDEGAGASMVADGARAAGIIN